MEKEKKKNPWGTSIGEAFGGDIPFRILKTGTAYYYGKNGTRATYDVTSSDEGTLTINGSVTYVKRGAEAYDRCKEYGIDLLSGWSKCP